MPGAFLSITCFNAFKRPISLSCFYNPHFGGHTTSKAREVIWIPSVSLLSQFGFPGSKRWDGDEHAEGLLGSPFGIDYHFWKGKKGREGNRIEQREKLDCGSISMKASTGPVESFEAEIAVKNWDKGPARPFYPCRHQSLDLDWPGKRCVQPQASDCHQPGNSKESSQLNTICQQLSSSSWGMSLVLVKGDLRVTS